jgi:hypothetical protein
MQSLIKLYLSYMKTALLGVMTFVILYIVFHDVGVGEVSMNTGNLDLEALIRAIIISLGVGLIVGAIGFFVMRRRAEWLQKWPVLVMGIVGVTMIIGTVTYYALPSLVRIPSLDGLSQAQAEDLLANNRLVPEVRPQYGAEADAGRVIPHSQNPSAGLSVRSGTVVSFAVGERGETPPITNPSPTTLSISLFQPKAGEKIPCSRGADGIYRLTVRGASSGLSDKYGLLLWERPVNPPADRIGWYLQRPPVNGIAGVEADGSWSGVAQVGNAQYPPHEGNIVDLAVTIADNDEINKLMSEQGVVVRNQPVGVKSVTASGVIVILK